VSSECEGNEARHPTKCRVGYSPTAVHQAVLRPVSVFQMLRRQRVGELPRRAPHLQSVIHVVGDCTPAKQTISNIGDLP
jgi:hypothetical protein